jgi:hypothetical protein
VCASTRAELLELVVLERHPFALRHLVALDDVVGVDFLARRVVDLLVPDAVSVLPVQLMEVHLVLVLAGEHAHRDRDESEADRA